jgi:hypothetical protein
MLSHQNNNLNNFKASWHPRINHSKASKLSVFFPDVQGTLPPTVTTCFIDAAPTIRRIKIFTINHKIPLNRQCSKHTFLCCYKLKSVCSSATPSKQSRVFANVFRGICSRLFGIVLKREEAISVLNELLDNCLGFDGHSFELSPPNSTPTLGGYQIIIKGILDEETKTHIQGVLKKHLLSSQTGSLWKTKRASNKTEPDTRIIYKPKTTHP